jgi:DNA-binding SARP family transcriptional activator/tetratricopeptide (TPR) repeat protein
MARRLEFGLLGPVVVRAGETDLPVPRGSQRVVLAVLLLNAGRVVSTGQLAEALWGATPPPSAPVTVRNYVKRLRQVLGDDGQARILSRPPGYLIQVQPGELDVATFEGLLGGARQAAGRGSWPAAAEQARAALALWRGEPLADVDSVTVALHEVPRLAELRLQAAELWTEAEIRRGRPGLVIPELERLAAAHPLREHLHALLMRALSRDGRPAEALAAYREARQVLVADLGVEPGRELREVQRQILAAGPAVRVPGLWPRELPGAVPQFQGRSAELARLSALLDGAGTGSAPAPLISAIAGMAGVGKTALALQWAHQVAARFPDGQLHVNLRGYDPGPPVTAAEALAGFLRSLGEREIPAATADRAARYRSLVAGRRLLIMMDNAREAEQVRLLLPGSASCLTLVTSRDALAGLVARDGAWRLDLGVLPQAEAVALLRALVGERVAAEPEAAATLASYCAGLPLALRVAAERAAAAPGRPLAEVTAQLADQQERLDRLDTAGDRRAAVRAVFSWSVQALDEEAARAFRLAGLHPAGCLDAYALAALTGSTLAQARRLLDRLSGAHLIEAAGPGLYALHDLLRAYAAELAVEQESERDRRAALTRLFDYYLATAAAAAAVLFRADPDQPELVAGAGRQPPFESTKEALAWLDSQRSTLVAVAAHGADHGWPGHAIGLAATVFRYLDVGHFSDTAAVHGHARRAARMTGDRAAEAAALTMLGTVATARGQLAEAAGHLAEALALCRGHGDRVGEARALGGLGRARYCQGQYEQAADCHRRALALYLAAGDRAGRARELHNLGLVDLRAGRPELAAGRLRQSLAFYRGAGLPSGEALVLCDLAELDLRQGSYGHADRQLRRSLTLGREAGSRWCQARALSGLGLADLRQGNSGSAISHLREALDLHSQAGNCSGQAEALNGLGEAFLAVRQADRARDQHSAALALAIRCGDQREQARAQARLAALTS